MAPSLRTASRYRNAGQVIFRLLVENHLLAESYEGESKDTLSLQNKITQAVAAEVSAKLTPREFQHLGSTRPVNPMAQEAYLRGRYFFAKRTAEGLRKSIEYYDQAIEKDANYASAYAALAESLILYMGYGHVNETETYPKAKMAALRALELDENLPESHTVMGLPRKSIGTGRVPAKNTAGRLSLIPTMRAPTNCIPST